MSSYLEIPLAPDDLIAGKDLKKIDQKVSIHQMIRLIAVTSLNEVRNDPFFGTDIWEYDFENIYNIPSLKEDLKKSLLKSIRQNEKRLVEVNVDLQIEQKEIFVKIQNKTVKTQIFLTVVGRMDLTNEPFQHREVFFIGPLSYDSRKTEFS